MGGGGGGSSYLLLRLCWVCGYGISVGLLLVTRWGGGVGGLLITRSVWGLPTRYDIHAEAISVVTI